MEIEEDSHGSLPESLFDDEWSNGYNPSESDVRENLDEGQKESWSDAGNQST